MRAPFAPSPDAHQSAGTHPCISIHSPHSFHPVNKHAVHAPRPTVHSPLIHPEFGHHAFTTQLSFNLPCQPPSLDTHSAPQCRPPSAFSAHSVPHDCSHRAHCARAAIALQPRARHAPVTLQPHFSHSSVAAQPHASHTSCLRPSHFSHTAFAARPRLLCTRRLQFSRAPAGMIASRLMHTAF